MNVATLNNLLYRPLKDSKEYDKFFKKTNCKSSFVGNGNTDYGIDQIKEVVLKYNYQTKKIASILKRPTTKETVVAIKDFLYNNIQYKADSYEQNLKTPYCVWSSKSADCKSFTIFASCILSNLNIPHFIRKVKQPSTPNRWSHVYVVVKEKQKKYVIDATIKSNIEVNYKEKKDIQMSYLPYSVLNAPETNVISKKANEMLDAFEEFKFFLDDLEKEGVSEMVTNKIYNRVKSYLEIGKDPEIILSENYIIIENERFDFYNGINAVITGTVAAATAIKGGKLAAILGKGSKIASGIKKVTGFLGSLFGKKKKSEVDVLGREGYNEKYHVIPTIEKAEEYLSKNNIPEAIRVLRDKINHEKSVSKNHKSADVRKGALYIVTRLEPVLLELQKSTNNNLLSNRPIVNPINQPYNFGNVPQNTNPFATNPIVNQNNQPYNFGNAINDIANVFARNNTPQNANVNTPTTNQQPLSKNNNNIQPNIVQTKKGMSTLTKVLIGAGVLGAVGGTVYMVKSKK